VTLNTLHSGLIYHAYGNTDHDQLPTKFEVPSFISSKDMTEDLKRNNGRRGDLWWLGSLSVIYNITV